MKPYRPLPPFLRAVSGLLVVLMVVPPNVLAQALTPPPQVRTIVINRGDPSRSTVTNLAVTFSTNVSITPPALVLQHLNTGTNLPGTNLALAYDASKIEATWTFPGLPGGSLPDGNWFGSLLSAAITNSGGALDGNGDGVPGDPFSFGVHRYAGDVNGDRDVDFADTYWLKSTWLLTNGLAGFDPRFDADGDGAVNTNDLPAFNANYFTVLPTQPAIFATVVNAADPNAQPAVTADPAIAGNVLLTNAASVLRGSLQLAASTPPDANLPYPVDLTSEVLTNGGFQLSSNRLAAMLGSPLALTNYVLYLQTLETNGLVSARFDLPFRLDSTQQHCSFPDENEWTASIAPAASPGSVLFSNCTAILTEGDSFQVTLERSFILQDPASSILAIQYETPSFDGVATNSMRDAFEIALVDDSGLPLTFTIQGAAGITPASATTPAVLPASPDACFNQSDGLAPFWAPGTAFTALNPQLSTLSLELSALSPGSTAKLILRLVNNDRDRATVVRITDVRFTSADPTLSFAGAAGTSFSLRVGDAGAVPNKSRSNFSSLGVVSASVQPEYGRTSYNEWTKVLYADLALRNVGTYPVKAPFYAGVTHISDPTVSLLSPDGVPYYDFSATLTNLTLDPAHLTLPRTLAFHNPNHVQFTYDLVVLGQLNQAPAFTSAPSLEAIPGKHYTYAFCAVDPDGDSLTYTLLSSPTGMVLNAQLSTLNFQPSTNQIGTHDITLQTSDGKGGVAEQHYLLNVISPPSNRPPYFEDIPPLVLHVGQAFSTQIQAVDPDGDRLSYAVDTANAANLLFVANAGFEALFLNPGQYVNWNVSGWNTQAHPSPPGVQNLGSAPEGRNVAYCNGSTISQTLTNVLQADTYYVLEVEVGDRADLPFPGYSVSLLAGTTVLASTSMPVPDNGQYVTAHLEFRCGQADTNIGKPLGIELKGVGLQVLFDNVRLIAVPGVESLITDNSGISFGTTNGLLKWTPTTQQVGLHKLVFTVNDGQGGTDSLSRFAHVLPAEGNKPPIILSRPATNHPVSGTEHISLPTGYVATVICSLQDGINGMALDGDHALYAGTSTSIFRYALPFGPLVAFKTNGLSSSSRMIVVDQSSGFGDSLIHADFNAFGNNTCCQGSVYQTDKQTGLSRVLLVGAANRIVGDPAGVALGPGGAFGTNLFVIDFQGASSQVCLLQTITPAGEASVFAEGVPWTTATEPMDVDFPSTNSNFGDYAYASDISSRCLWRVNPQGQISQFGMSRQFTPIALGFAEGGLYGWDLYVIDASQKINRVAADGTVTTFVDDASLGGGDMAFSKDGRYMYFSEGSRVIMVREGQSMDAYYYQVRAADPDGDSVTYSLISGPDTMIINKTNGLISWKAMVSDLGPHTVRVRISDMHGAFADQDYVLTVVQASRSDITGAVFDDANRDGVFDLPGESGLGGFLVYLDANSNGLRDPGERSVRTASDGTYAFGDMPLGTHRIGVELTSGLVATAPSSRFQDVTLTQQGLVDHVNFGTYRPSRVTNHNPVFVTTPPTTTVIAKQSFFYQAAATDTDGDLLTFDLISNPAGMVSETNTGVVAWQPVSADIGVHDVVLRVQDGCGGFALQSWQITVVAPNSVPVVTTVPPGPAVVGLPYRYVVRAQDAENGLLTFSLETNSPAGMTLTRLDAVGFGLAGNSNSAVLAWTPALTNLGSNRVEIVVRDPSGAEARQIFDLQVVASSPNQPPQFVSTPRTQARLGMPYQYLAQALDGDGDPVSFELLTGPTGMVSTNSQPPYPNSALLAWTPEQLGTNWVSLRITDNRGGTNLQEFGVLVSSTLSNSAPIIVSTPLLHGTMRQAYEYDLKAVDADGDSVSWELLEGPVGMSLDTGTGALRWTPSEDQLGNNPVSVRARDQMLAETTQSFVIAVGFQNENPAITSVPPVSANVGQSYLYAPRATDPDSDTLSWALLAPTPGMTIDAATGLIRWTPATNQVGAQFVQVRVSDGRGGTDTQKYTLNAVNNRANHTPIIITSPLRGATVDRQYSYALRATDPDGDTLTLQGLLLPAGAVITNIVSAGGQIDALLLWTPTATHLGPNDLILAAQDPSLASASQRFTVMVRSNNAPVISSTPRTSAVPNAAYRYDVVAHDSDGDALTYALAQGPSGMAVDSLGRIAWQPTPAQLGSNAVTIAVTDFYGATATQSFAVNVIADTQPPAVSLTLIQGLINPADGQWAGDLGTTVAFQVTASDNIGVASRALRVGTQDIPLNSSGVGYLTVSSGGLMQVVASATDTAGNTSTTNRTILFRDPNAQSTLAITIHSPTNTAEVLKAVPIVGSITSLVALASYSVEFAELTSDSAEMSVGDPSLDFRTITNVTLPAGTFAINNAVLGRFDPTILKNGAYLIRVTAYDQNAQGQQEGVGVFVSGNLKFGEFSLAFNDLTVPVAGIPITIKRVYDTRDSRRQGDFGYGWSLGVQDAQIRPTLKNGTMYYGSKVYVTGPDGRRIGFTTEADVTSSIFGMLTVVKLKFRPDAGVYEKLEIVGNNEFWYSDGMFLDGLWDTPVNPDTYRLTLKDGTAYVYSRKNGLQNVADLNGNRLILTRDGIFHYSAGSSTPDQQVPFTRDARGRITRITDPSGNALNYTYDAQGDLHIFADQAANITQYAYSAARAHYLTNIIDPLGRNALRLEYDAAGRLLGIRDANGNLSEQGFDADSNTVRFVDANGHPQIIRYDDNGNELMKVVEGVSTNSFEYDANNNLTKTIDARGYVTTRTYDNQGNLARIVDALTNTTTITYNSQNKPTSVTDALGRTTQFRYDNRGELTNVVNALGGQAAFTRDAQGRVTSVTDFNGHTTRYDYTGGCSCGKPGKIFNPDGSFRLYEYNSQGQNTREVNELGHETLSNYDEAGRLLRVRDAMSNTTRYAYSGSLKISETDPLGRTTWYGYDDLNRQIAITNAMGGVVRFEYDNGTNRTAVVDPVGNITRFYYDAANRLTHQVDPWGRTNFFAYDAAGNRTDAIDRNGRRRTFAHDGLNRRTHEYWWEGTNLVRTIEFTFNALGVMTGASDPASTLRFDLDALNRLERSTQTGITNLPDFTLTYAYDGMTNVVSVTDNWGVQVASAYDIRSRLSQRVWQGGGLPGASLRFHYDSAGNRTNILRFADSTGTNLIGHSRYAYNALGAITDILHANATNATLAEYHYQRDPAQQIIQRLLNGQSVDYSYDLTAQLTNALYSAGQPDETYRYDANGNRIGGGYVVTTNNQIVADGTNIYSYDFEGSMVGRSNTATHATTAYNYDHRNRLVGVVDSDAGGTMTQTVEFTYDALNRRIAKSVNGSVVRFLLNQDNIWADTAGIGAITARYLLGSRIDEMLARHHAGESVFWYLTDKMGTVHDLVDSTGAVVNHIKYDSFGKILAQSVPAEGDRFLFTGREWDSETGLMFYRARYYSPQIGRFVSLDPIGFGSREFNLHRYASNNPITVTDPYGNVSFIDYLALTLAVVFIKSAWNATVRQCEFPVDSALTATRDTLVMSGIMLIVIYSGGLALIFEGMAGIVATLVGYPLYQEAIDQYCPLPDEGNKQE